MVMDIVDFEIKQIYAGWFDVSFGQGTEKLTISASDAWGNDSPRKFLEVLYDMYAESAEYRFVIWDEEPGEYFICMDRFENRVRLIVSYSEDAEDMLGRYFRSIEGDLSYEEIRSFFDDLQDLLVVENLDLKHFVKNVYEEFRKCDIEVYQGHWMDYPYEQMEKMKAAFKS